MSRIDEALRRAREPHTGERPVEEPASSITVDDLPPPMVEPKGLFTVAMTAASTVTADVQAYESMPVDVPETCLVEAPPERRPWTPNTSAGEKALPRATDEQRTEQKRAGVKLVVSAEISPIAVEQYRRLAATLHKVQVERGKRVLMISSTMAGEGKTLTASNLALTLSESFGRQVLLIDADLRRPTIHEVFQLSNTKGLNDCLCAEDDQELPLVAISPRLTILPAGRPNPDPMSGLTSARMRRIIEEAAARFEWVVLDTPPVGLLPDASLLTEMVDMVVLVIGAGTTPFRLIERTVKAVDRKKLIGVVLNRAAESQSAYQYYRYYANAG
jgi:capsular exopolysaccharide synthesis family protein